MKSTQELVSMQYALALLIGQDLDLSRMLRKFLPPALKLLNCKSGFIWLTDRNQDLVALSSNHPETKAANIQPTYSYPNLNVLIQEKHPEIHDTLSQLSTQQFRWLSAPKQIEANHLFIHLLPIGQSGVMALTRNIALSNEHILALQPLLARLETACQACMQHAYIEVERQEAIKAKEVSEQANKAKSQFLAMISHEIRTPMNGVIGLTDLMLFSKLLPGQRENLEMIKSSSNALLDIINELLDFSRMESGTITLNKASFRFRELFSDTMMPLSLKAQNKSLYFNYEISDSVPDLFLGDAGRIRQVLINLIGNAIKFTETGGITIQVSKQSHAAPNTANVSFAIKDTGIGIPQDKLDSIFEAFQQADTSINRRYGGTGLGLSISAELVKKMGGELQVDSELGTGSIFFFTLSLALVDQIQEAPTATQQRLKADQSFNILLAEDNAVNRMLAVHLLKKAGHKIIVAENGQEAYERWLEKKPDLVLMDMQMPIMDGLEATKKIRLYEQENNNAPTPIIALTANALKSDQDRCLASGMNAFLSKPFKAPELLQVIDQTTQRS